MLLRLLGRWRAQTGLGRVRWRSRGLRIPSTQGYTWQRLIQYNTSYSSSPGHGVLLISRDLGLPAAAALATRGAAMWVHRSRRSGPEQKGVANGFALVQLILLAAAICTACTASMASRGQ